MKANKTNNNHRYSEVAKRELDGFIHTTAVKTFQFIKHSAHWTESVFWVLLLSAATVFAIRDVRKACFEFMDDVTATSMHVMGLQNLTFNDAIICVDYDPHYLTRSAPKIAEEFNATNASTEFLQKSLRLFTVLSLLEVGRSVDYEKKVAALLGSTSDLQQFHDQIRAQNNSVDQLWRDVGAWLCFAVKIQITTFARGALLSTIDPCDPEKITWLGVIPFVSIPVSETTFCLDIGKQLSFDSILDLIVISINNDDLLKGPAEERTGDYILNSYLDLSGDPVSSDMTKDYIEFPSQGCGAVRIGIDAELRLLDRDAARCAAVTTKGRLACYGECDARRYEKVSKQCNCSGIAWPYGNTSCFDSLTLDERAECRRLVPRVNFSESCFQSCLFPCVLRQVSIDAANPGCEIYSMYRMRGVALELAPKQFTATVFEEHFAVGMTELFSRIGGTCGLWLGVGMLGICHVLLFPLKLLSKFVQRQWTDAAVSVMELNDCA